MKHSIAFAFIVLGILLLAGCTENQKPPKNETTGNGTMLNNSNSTNEVPTRPFTDSAVIKAKILNVQPQSAQLEILQVLSYAPDQRDGTIKLATGDIRNFTFQWGTLPTVVDMPPLGPSSTDVRLNGVTTGSTLNANIMISRNLWTVYTYEQLD